MADRNNKNAKNGVNAKEIRQATLLSKLDLQKDERLTRIPIETGRISHFLRTFKTNYAEIMLSNLLFMVFALPAIAVIFFVVPNMIKTLNAGLDFNGDMGIGLGGKNEILQGMLNIYNTWQWGFLMLVPCIALMGIGFAGLFYCMRNYLWGAPVKIRVHFFRGIKKRWAEFLLSFTYVGFVVWAVGFSILEYLKNSLQGAANAGHWVFMIASCFIALLSLLFLMNALPMFVSFKYKFKSVVKNSVIFSITMLLIEMILIVLLALPFLLLLSSFTKMIFYVAFAMIGFGFYAMAITALAHNFFDSTIIPLYEYELKNKEKEERKEREREMRIANANRKNSKKKNKR